MCWNDISETVILGLDMVKESANQVYIVRERMKVIQDRQIVYVSKRRRLLEFNVGDEVFLKVLPMKGVGRFRKWGKLSFRYIGFYEIFERIGKVVY